MLQKRIVILVLLIFSLGWVANSLISSLFAVDLEKPYFFSFSPYSGFNKAPERLSPADHISESQVHVYNDKVVLDIPKASWAQFTDTNSMDPFLDKGANSIEIAPSNPEDIHVGDVVSYQSKITNDLIIHRVISKEVDDNGIFFLVKGDNNPAADPQKIRFEDVRGVVVGVVY
ncbi:signal peptidase I [Candidatus Woesearchaeota archaeon]|nr:signal peptidase I [Candidatus Woesearchaeota archaeon]